MRAIQFRSVVCRMLLPAEGMRFEAFTVLQIETVVFQTTWCNNTEYTGMNMLIMFCLFMVWLSKKTAQSWRCNLVYIFLSFQNMPTGSIEVVLKEFKVINPAKKQLPFVIRDFQKVMDFTDKYKLESSAVYYH